MKKILSAALLLLFTSIFSQQAINFKNGSFKEILAQAKTEKKLVFLDAYASWCAPCKLMEKNIFTRPAVKKYYDENFVNARIDMEKGEGREIAQKYGIRSYPSFLFLNGDGEVVLKNFGYMEENEFLTFAKEANNPKLKDKSYVQLFEQGEKDPEFLLNMMRTYVDSDYELAKKVSERYFNVKKDEPLTRDDLGMLLFFLKSTEDASYSIFKAKKAEIEQLMSPQVYEQFDVNIKISKFLEKALDQRTGLIDDANFYKNAVPLVGKAKAETALNRMKVLYYPSVENYNGYEEAALAYYRNTDDFDPAELLRAAWTLSQHSNSATALQTAQMWAEKSVMKGENPDNTYVLATLYAKNGKKDLAKTYAEMSRDLAQQEGKDAGMATALINSLK